jgi:hypothetical protein
MHRSHPECYGEDNEDRYGEQASGDRIRLLSRVRPLRGCVLSAFRGGRPLVPGLSFLAQTVSAFKEAIFENPQDQEM